MTDIPGQENVPDPNKIPGAEPTGPPPGGAEPPAGGIPPAPPPPGSTVPVAPEPGGTPPEPPPGRSNATNWLLAAILVALVAIAAVLIFDGGDDVETEATASIPVAESTTTEAEGDDTTTTEPAETTTSVVESTTTVAETTTTTVAETTTTASVAIPSDPAASATAWIDAIAAGDIDTAWVLMAPESQEAIGGRDGFDGVFGELQEGWGAWADATAPNGQDSPWVFENQVDGEVAVVTYAGLVTQEGTTSDRADALPVMVSSDAALVQPFLGGDPIQWVVPDADEEPSVVFPNAVFEVIVPGLPAVQFFIWDEAVESVVTDNGGNTALAVTEPVTRLETGGLSVITVVYLEEGLIDADAFLVVVGEND